MQRRNYPSTACRRLINQTLRVVQLTSIILLACTMTLSAKTVSQTITYSGKNVKLENIFLVIKQQTGYLVTYNPDNIKAAEPVDIDVYDEPLTSFMNIILKDQSFDFNIEGNTIFIKKKLQTPDLTGGSLSRKKVPPVIGIVIGPDGQPLAGVNVVIKGTKRGTTTDKEGRFIIEAEEGSVLEITSIGFGKKEVSVNGGKELVVALDITSSVLDEVQYIAYGTTSKRLNTGNVSTVKGEDIRKQPVTNPLAALQGRVPGMLITQNTGVVGGGFSVRIRGRNSITNGNDPLYVIDGIPYISGLLPSMGYNILGTSSNNTVGNPLNYINPSDIESIDVLKDADATAIYGSRGANGVVLITTRRGKPGKTKVEVNANLGQGKITHKLDWLNSREYIDMRLEAFKNDGVTPDSINAPDLFKWDTSRYTDWQKELIGGTARYLNANFTVSGGNDYTQFLVGATYNKSTTVFPGDFSDQKGSMNFNITNTSLNKKFKMLVSGNYQVDINNLMGTDLTYYLKFLPPIAPNPFNEDGTLNWANGTWPSTNPYAEFLKKYDSKTYNLVSKASLSYCIFRGLELKTDVGFTNLQVNDMLVNPMEAINPQYRTFAQRDAYYTDNSSISWNIDPQILYNRKIGKNSFDILAAATFQKTVNDGQQLYATGFTSDALLSNPKAAPIIRIQSVTNNQYRYNAVFGRVTYNYDEKYIVNLTARRDGSSRFGPGKQFANFGAVGLGWIFTEEKFIKDFFPFLSFGKVRTSYGTAGNDQIGDYLFLDLYSSTYYPYQGIQALFPERLYNPDFAWEEYTKFEGALKLGLFKDRILFEVSYYRNRSSNQLVGFPLPSMTGFNTITSNQPATVQNTGLEFVLETANIKSGKFSWTSSVNITASRNKLLAFSGLENSSVSHIYIIGKPLTITRLYPSNGVDPQTGQLQFIDHTGKLTYEPNFSLDRTVILNTDPKYYGGFQNTLQYGGFQLDFLLEFKKQIGSNYLYSFLPGYPGVTHPSYVLKRWQKPGDITGIQRFTQDFGIYNTYEASNLSVFAYSDASYVRLKNISISYEFPETMKQKLKIQNLRFYVQGQNLFTIANFYGYDPENQSTSNLPPLRVWTTGVQIGF